MAPAVGARVDSRPGAHARQCALHFRTEFSSSFLQPPAPRTPPKQNKHVSFPPIHFIHQAINFGGFASAFVTVSPAYFKVYMNETTLNVTIAGVGGTVPATATVSYVSKPAFTSGVVEARATADGKGIAITILDLSRFPDPATKIPVTIGYTVTSATGGKGVGVLAVFGPAGAPPTGPSPVDAGAAELGVPLVVDSATVLAGWTDPNGYPFGVALAKPIGNRGVAQPIALTNNGNWSAAELYVTRIASTAYTCLLPDLRLASGVPTATRPSCLAGPSGLELAVVDTRLSYAKPALQATVAVAAGPVYPAPLVGLKDGGAAARTWAAKLGFAVVRAPALTTSSVTWGSTGLSAAVSPAAASATSTVLTLPAPTAVGDGTFATAATLAYSGNATLFGFSSSITGAKGTLTLTATLTDGTDTRVVPLSLVQPVPVSGVKVYGGLALFGAGWTVQSVEVKAVFASAAGRVALADFDASKTERAYPTIV